MLERPSVYGYQKESDSLKSLLINLKSSSLKKCSKLNNIIMKFISSLIYLLLFLSKPLLAQEVKPNALQAKFNYLMAPALDILGSTNTYHRTGIGIDFDYDRLLYSKMDVGLSFKGGLQISNLNHLESYVSNSFPDGQLVQNRFNLYAFRLGLGPYLYERLKQDFYLLTKFHLGYSFILLNDADLIRTAQLGAVSESIIRAPFGEYSLEFVFELNEKISISMGGQISICELEFTSLADPNRVEYVDYNNIGFNTGFRIKL